MAMDVIERFEAVNIDNEQSQGGFAAYGAPPFFVQRVVEGATVATRVSGSTAASRRSSACPSTSLE
jgi:hypothetical protein